MEQNPYQTPESSVADPVSTPLVRPKEVSRACTVFWVVLVIGLVSMLPAIRGEWWRIPELEEAGIEGAEQVFMVGMGLFVLIASGAYALLTWLTGRRHNWARWTLLAYLVFGWYVTGGTLTQTFSATPLAGLIDLLSLLAEMWACTLLFFGPGARWFSQTAA